jgi:uncharacterized protein YpuA (DUF1002 family)
MSFSATQESDNSFGDGMSQEQSFNESDDFAVETKISLTGQPLETTNLMNLRMTTIPFHPFDEGNQGGDSMSDAASDVDTEGIMDTAKNVLSSLWDFFNGDD